jgi:alpha-N-arabinofuranosidase
VDVEQPLTEWARMPANRVRCKLEAYEEYLKRIPGLRERKIPINIDEWAYSRVRPNLKQALADAWVFHEMFRHTGIIKMAAHTMGTSCVDYNGASAALNLTGVLFKLYRDHFGVVPVNVAGSSPQPPPQFLVGGDQPRINAGSDTYPLDVSAALTADGRSLTVAIMNPTVTQQELSMAFTGIALRAGGRVWRFTGADVNAAIPLGQKATAEVIEAAVNEAPETLRVPPISISIYEFPKR